VSDLVNTLSSEKEGRYNGDLEALLKASRNAKLRAAILDFFALLEWNEAEADAIGFVDGRDSLDPGLVSSALSYLAAIRSKDALKFSEALVKEDDKKLLPSLVKLMGRSGGEPEEIQLIAWLDSDSAAQSLKEEAIKALGDIGSTKAASRLGKLVEDANGGKAARMFACASLAKIKDPSSVSSLVKAANDSDPNVRTSALDALGAFASSPDSVEARNALAQGLRDSFANARIAACKAASTAKLIDALPILRYKAQNDPEKAVKREACRSVAQIGGEDSFAFLRGLLEDKKGDADIRVFCFGLLARYDPDASMATLSSRLKAESAEKEKSFYTALAREVANAQDAPKIAELARVLLADKDYLIRIAAIEWARKTKAPDFRPDLEKLAKDDPSDQIKKRATDALKAYG
jgi:FOG: HEAT repeat